MLRNPHPSGWQRWGIAIAAMVAAGAVRIIFWPELFKDATFLPFFGAVLFAAWYGGLGPGLMALGAGAAWTAWSVFPPLEDFSVSDPSSQVAMSLYIGFGLAICSACHTLHRSRQREREALSDLHQRELRSLQLEAEASRLAAVTERNERFLLTLAHELRNPLAPVRYAVDLARRRPDSVDTALATIDRQVSHLNRLVEDLVDAGRISRGTLELRPEAVLVSDILSASIEASLPAIEQGAHRLNVVPPAPTLSLHGDPVRVVQVLVNLLNNAAKFSEQGSMLQLETTADDAMVAFVITDSGMGIDPSEVERLMQPFEQGKPLHGRVSAGLGIGLALARQIVDLHGGSLVLQPAPSGVGTRATARFPRAPDARTLMAAISSEVRPGRMRALVADDNPDAVASLAMLLEVHDQEVVTASDGEDACEVAARHLPEVAFIDIGMPKRDGLEVARWIRQQPWGSQVYLVAATGWGEANDLERTRDAGFDLHLVKPVDPSEIVRALKLASDARQLLGNLLGP